MSHVLTVATRRGQLAIAQTQSVIAALKARHPQIEIRIREIVSRDARTGQAASEKARRLAKTVGLDFEEAAGHRDRIRYLREKAILA